MKVGHQQMVTSAISPDVAVPVSLAACHAAWLRARRGKRPSANQLAFEVRWMDRLLKLKTALRTGVWQPARTVSFIVSHPKTREIHAPDFADRVVHHLLVERLEKLYEPVFIHDSYANRLGKGSHAAVDRLQQFMRSRNGQGWYLQLDIHNYFNSINRHILYQMLCHRLQQCERRAELPAAHVLALRSLCHKLLANKVSETVRDPAAAARLPPHKRLANAAPGCGIPVGNLTSQFFANVYLNALDQFVKHTLKCRHYVRYVDDFVLLADDAAQLRQWQGQINEFLAATLGLKCKDAVLLQPLCQGIDFLSYRVFAGHRRVRPRVVAHCRAKLQDWAARHVQTGGEGTLLNPDNPLAGHSRAGGNPARTNTPRSGQNRAVAPLSREIFNQLDSRLHPQGVRGGCMGLRPQQHTLRGNDGVNGLSGSNAVNALAQLQAMLGSYWGHFAHAQSVRLRHTLFEQFNWLKSLFVLHPDGRISPRWVLHGATFAAQASALQAAWPEAHCLIQKGNRWLLLSQGGRELNATATRHLMASLRRRGLAFVCANQTGWLRHGTRRREVQTLFHPSQLQV